jgi:hypothetical protein
MNPSTKSEMSSVLFSSGSYNQRNHARDNIKKVESKVVDLEKKIADLEFVITTLQKTGLGSSGSGAVGPQGPPGLPPLHAPALWRQSEHPQRVA